MSRRYTLAILSDIHYAGPAEQAEGDDYEFRVIENPLLRTVARIYRNLVWLREPLQQTWQIDRFLARVKSVDCVVANGDYSANVAAMGVSNDKACASARECLGKLRAQFGDKFHATFGDHEFGKSRLFGTYGQMPLKSWQRATGELGLEPFWQITLGNYVLMGVVSSLIALPVFESETIPDERPEWYRLREEHFAKIRAAFAALAPQQRLLLFCHDPTALPYLWEMDVVRAKVPQIEQTIIGHLHSNLYLWKSRLLAGMPVIRFLGRTPQRMSIALNKARLWRPFRIRLCPAMVGTQLLNDGGYLTAVLDEDAKTRVKFQFHGLPR